MIRNIVIVSACRTAFDKFGGVMKDVPSIELGKHVLEKVVENVNFPKDKVEYIFLRNHDPRGDRSDGKRSGKTGFIKGRIPGNDPVDDR